MAISMNTNTTAMSSTLVMDKAHQKLSVSHQNMGKGTKQLSAADTQIIGKMEREVSGIKVGQTNIKKATSMLGIAQGAFQSVNDLLTQMKEKAFAATNVANGVSERKAYQEEFSSLGKQLERVFTNTTFNGEKLLAKGGKLDGKLVFQTGTQNSTPMEAEFTKQLKGLMAGISEAGTVPKATGGGIAQSYYDALSVVLKAESKAKAYNDAIIAEKAAKDATDGVDVTVANTNGTGITQDMMSVFADTSVTLASISPTESGATVILANDTLEINAEHTLTTNTLGALGTDTYKKVATDASIARLEELAVDAEQAAEVGRTTLNAVYKNAGFVHKGALHLDITDNQKSQEATVALEKLALSFDEMNSNVQALMDSMKAQSEMQATIINKTEEAMGATRDTDYMEETSNIAAAKLRNVTAMAAVKQSYEITSTIINTLVNVNN